MTGVHNLLYTVPPGMVAIVRDVDLVPGVTSAAFIFLYSGVTGATWCSRALPTVNVQVEWRGRQVFPAGTDLRASINVGGVACDVSVSGYLLTA
jgi:hypothetical protein